MQKSSRHLLLLAFALVIGAGFLALRAAAPVPGPTALVQNVGKIGNPTSSEATSPALQELRRLIDRFEYQRAHVAAVSLLNQWDKNEADPAASELDALLRALVETVWNVGGSLGAAENSAIDRLLERNRRKLGENDPRHARILSPRANLYIYSGDYEKARAILEHALALQESTPLTSPHDLAETLTLLGQVATYENQYARAILYGRRKLRLAEQTTDRSKELLAGILTDLSDLYMATGDLSQAKSAAERSLALREEVFPAGHGFIAIGLDSLSVVYRALGEFSKAKALSERAVAIVLAANGSPQDATYAAFLTGLAQALSGLGDNRAALETAQKAVRMAEAAVGAEDRRIQFYLRFLAIIQANAGDLQSAKESYERAVRLQTKHYGASHFRVGETLARLSKVEYQLGESDRGLEHALRAEKIVRDQFLDLTHLLSESQALTFESIRVSGFQVATSVLSRRGESGGPGSPVAAFWDELIRSRALILEEMASRQHLLSFHQSPEISAQASALIAVRNQLSALMVRGPGASSAETYRQTMAELESEREGREQALAEMSAEFRGHEALARAGLAEVAAVLPPHGALVAYLRYVRLPAPPQPGASPLASAPSLPSYLALVLGPGRSDPQLLDLGQADRIDDLIRRWWKSAGTDPAPLSVSGSASEAAYREIATRLRRAIWDPIQPKIAGAGRVFVVPDGAINLVNLATLPAPGNAYLIDSGPSIHYLSAERDLLRPESPSRGSGILALGGPDFDSIPGPPDRVAVTATPRPDAGAGAGRIAYRGSPAECADFQSMRFSPLPAAGEEVAQLELLWADKTVAGQDAAATVHVLRGPEASEAAFKAMAPGRRVLHLATHGFFLDDRCGSTLDGARQERGAAGPSGGGPGSNRESPFQLAGLALAGANRRASAQGCETCEDGILTAEEIASLDLSSVEWAVLSACESGVGKIVPGEGVVGLRRSFQVAGVGTVIMSLWQIEDRSTQEWMRGLYQARLRGASTADAVLTAARESLRARRAEGKSTHPFHWGAFVAAGDWR